MRVRHPNAVRETADDVDDRVSLQGTTYDVGGDGVVQGDVPEAAARSWADAYGLTVADIRVGTDGAEADEDGAVSEDRDEADTCTVVKNDGDVCGRDRPCPYHD